MFVVFSKKDNNDFDSSDSDCDSSSKCRMMMSGTSTGRNELIYELRETSLLGNAIQKCVMVDKAVQIEPNMDLGSGDSADYSIVSIKMSFFQCKVVPKLESIKFRINFQFFEKDRR